MTFSADRLRKLAGSPVVARVHRGRKKKSRAYVWTRGQDDALRDLRGRGLSWREIAHDVGVPMQSARLRGIKLGLNTFRKQKRLG